MQQIAGPLCSVRRGPIPLPRDRFPSSFVIISSGVRGRARFRDLKAARPDGGNAMWESQVSRTLPG